MVEEDKEKKSRSIKSIFEMNLNLKPVLLKLSKKRSSNTKKMRENSFKVLIIHKQEINKIGDEKYNCYFFKDYYYYY